MYGDLYNWFFTAASEQKDEESWKIFNQWRETDGKRSSSVEQLEWIMTCYNIPRKTKEALVKIISEKSDELDDEEDTLLKLGDVPESYSESVANAEREIKECQSKERAAYITTALIALAIFLTVVYRYRFFANGPMFIIGQFFFTCAILLFMQAFLATKKIKAARAKANQVKCALIGNLLQKRITTIKSEQKLIGELNKIIVRNLPSQ